ncbi:MAG: hypothetical protein K2M73_08940 [Lachnospiraceae bacterium]|nr:hypothetical protein [Lachnospiraceae bacterium]
MKKVFALFVRELLLTPKNELLVNGDTHFYWHLFPIVSEGLEKLALAVPMILKLLGFDISK